MDKDRLYDQIGVKVKDLFVWGICIWGMLLITIIALVIAWS